MKTYFLERLQIIPRPRGEAFAFFCDAFNLERITPPFLRFHILTSPPIKIEAGTVIDYRLSLFGAPIRWRTVIESWIPEQLFVDRQIKGPYAYWRHTHSFEERGPRQILMRDLIEYSIPYAILGRVAHRLFVKRWLNEIFNYRAAMTAHLLEVEDKVEELIERNRAIREVQKHIRPQARWFF